MRKALFFVIGFCLVLSCSSRRQIIERLDVFEDQLQAEPYEVLCALDSIDRDDLSSKSLRARHAMLFSMALDKSYIDIQEDSIARTAVNYYKNHLPLEYRMKSYYSLGRVKSNAKDYISAVIAFEHAESAAKDLKDYHYLGLIYRNLAIIYESLCDFPKDYHYTNLAINSFIASEEPVYENYEKLRLADYHISQRQFEEAKKLLKYLIQGKLSGGLLANAYISYAKIMSFDGSGDPDSTIYYYQKAKDINAKKLSAQDYALVANAFALKGITDSVSLYVKTAKEHVKTADDYARLKSAMMRVHKNTEEYEKAFHDAEDVLHNQDSLLYDSFLNSIDGSIKDIYRRDLDIRALEDQRNRTLWGAAIIILSLIALWVIFDSRRRIRIEREKTSNEISKIHCIKEELEAMKSSQEDAIYAFSNMISKEISELSSLADKYYCLEDNRRYKNHLSSEENNLLDSFGAHLRGIQKNCFWMPELEKVLNASYNNVMTRLRSDFKNNTTVGQKMQPDDFIIIPLLFAKFPISIISFITGHPEQRLRTRKTRYKEKFKALNNTNTQDYLHLIE